MIRLLKYIGLTRKGLLMNSFYLFLLGGMLAMLVIMLVCGRHLEMPAWKIVIFAVILTAVGYLGAKCMSFIESGDWSGRSLFGSIFLAPVLMYPVAKIFKTPYGQFMDICAPAECIMLALLKVKCTIDGCCGGRTINLGGSSFVFPSQKVECAVFLIIMIILAIMVFKDRYQGIVYPYYMVIYGVARFLLNLLRDTTPWIGPLPAGNFWSLISIAIGIIAIACIKRNSKKQLPETEE